MTAATSFLESASSDRYDRIRAWLLTTDHKRIGLLYMWVILFWFCIAVLLGVLLRIELSAIGETVMDAQTYNAVFTLHGVMMIFLFVIPAMPAIFGNFLLPIQIGAQDVFFPRLNLFSWYLYVSGGILAIVSLFTAGAPDTGWTFYVPFSVTSETGVSLGRYLKSTGAYNFVALSEATPGAANAAPATMEVRNHNRPAGATRARMRFSP